MCDDRLSGGPVRHEFFTPPWSSGGDTDDQTKVLTVLISTRYGLVIATCWLVGRTGIRCAGVVGLLDKVEQVRCGFLWTVGIPGLRSMNPSVSSGALLDFPEMTTAFKANLHSIEQSDLRTPRTVAVVVGT